jgi:hypothetical protein
MSFVTLRTLVFAVVVALGATYAIPAAAQQCSVQPPEIADFRNAGDLPSSAQQDAVLDVIHEFAWTLDIRDLNNFDNLFASDAVYEACTAGGVRITLTNNLTELKTYFQTQPFAFLSELNFRTSHFITNAIFRTSKEDEIKVWAAMLVTLQRPDVEAPDLDYTATLVMTLIPDNGAWKFSDVRMVTGTPLVVFRAR